MAGPQASGAGPRQQDLVALTDLEVIDRWSVAVRRGEADREELIAVLREDLAWLEDGRPAPAPGRPARRRVPGA